jgi:hypothetical protein
MQDSGYGYLLIPQGSRLIGTYNHRVAYGQRGLQVIWTRLIYPDGTSINLEGMIGQDAQGQSGFRDQVDNHYARLIGFALLRKKFSKKKGALTRLPFEFLVIAGAAAKRRLRKNPQTLRRRRRLLRPPCSLPLPQTSCQ